MFSSSSSSSLARRSRLLDAARGWAWDENQQSKDVDPIEHQTRPPLRCFALQRQHVENNLLSASPREFHATLCALIRKAKRRVSLASLYIGPAASSAHTQESELLQALAGIDTSVDVQIVMDSNRGLRSVPVKDSQGNESTTSAAKAVADAIHLQDNHQLYLCQVLSDTKSTILPNPLNEVAGVFHLKAYIVDDTLILSGANLSEEYFVDRKDRYIQISKGGNGLVDFYADLIHLLCIDYSEPYHSEGHENYNSQQGRRRSLEPFLEHLRQLFEDPNPKSSKDLLQEPETVAICIPTLNHPQESQILNHPTLPSDVKITLDLLREASSSFSESEVPSPHASDDGAAPSVQPVSVKLSSAYLNPPNELVESLKPFESVDLLTAGRLSHGFKPKATAGNKGKAWIPTVFDHLQLETMEQLERATLLHWQRVDWTFHAKGLWITQDREESTASSEAKSKPELLAAITGSSNFGRRSFERDMESNIVLVFPPEKEGAADQENPLASALMEEWNLLIQDSQEMDPNQIVQDAPPLPFYVSTLFRFIKSFF